MKIVSKGQFNHSQLASQKTGEVYSLSAVISQLLGSKQLFIHHDIIAPGNKSSGPHRHTIIEEAVYIVKGTAIVVEGENEVVAAEGTLILFDPKDKEVHFWGKVIKERSNMNQPCPNRSLLNRLNLFLERAVLLNNFSFTFFCF